jgi:uncharacterized protein YecE (DUF72 family)
VELRTGTSGFAYDGWRGTFYPEDLPAARRLAFYAQHLRAVEINNTFYRLPRRSVLEGWARQVPEDFCFVLKASRRITHLKRLRDAGEEVAYLYATAQALGPRRGPILFQLPPHLPRDLPRLESFLAGLPDGHQAAFEFRHPSWWEPEVLAALRARGAALCVADTDDAEPPELADTAPFGYLRLRRAGYDDAALERWLARLRARPWERAFVFFKHEEAGVGPALAARLQALFEARAPRRARAPSAAGAGRAS